MSDNTFYEVFVMDMFKSELDNPEDEHQYRRYCDHFGELHAAVGLAGEAGEVLDLFKKTVFTDKPFSRDDLVKELGDVEFYLQALRTVSGISRDEVLDANVVKLNNRHPEGFSKSDFYKKENG